MRTFNRAEVRCIEYETIRGKQRRTGEICVNSAQGTLARWRRGEIESEWTDYAPFGDMLYPRHLVVKENGNRTLEADIQVYAAPDLSAAIFQIPTGMEIREACEHITRPVRIAGDDPIYPYRLGKFRSVGTVVVHLRIGIEGRVEKAQIIQTAGSDLDDAAMEAVKKWVFEPAKCDGKPIPQRVDVQVNFKR